MPASATNVIRAIAGYAGQPCTLRRSGRPAVGHPFTDHMRFTIAPPGRLPLRNTLFSLVDVPACGPWPTYGPRRTASGWAPGRFPSCFIARWVALAWLRAPGWSARCCRSRRSCISRQTVWPGASIEGACSSKWKVCSRRARRPGARGTFWPKATTDRLFRRWPWTRWCGKSSRDRRRRSGLAPLFASWSSTTTRNRSPAEPSSRHQECRGRWPFALCPACWARSGGTCRLKSPTCTTSATQHRRRAAPACDRGTGRLARWRPPSSVFPERQPIRLSACSSTRSARQRPGPEPSEAQFFSSRQSAGRGRSERLLCERFGPLTFAMALVPEEGRLRLVLRRWSAFGVPLPMWLCPHSD